MSMRREGRAAETLSEVGALDCGRAPLLNHPKPQRPAPVRGTSRMLTILLDGVAYGMLLFVLASGLSVTLGLMNFINLAHGAFAMVGGYVTALLMNRAGAPFLADPAGGFPRFRRSSGSRSSGRSIGGSMALVRSTRCCSPSASF